MRTQASRLADPRREEARVGRMFNLPPSYLLIHRVTLGSIGVLCQLGATAPFRELAETLAARIRSMSPPGPARRPSSPTAHRR